MNNYERERAIMEAARNSSCDAYFTARPQIDSIDRRRVYEAGFQAGAASRDAEVQRLQMALADTEALELGTAEKCDQLRAELVKALAACKVKDEALNAMLERFGIMSDACIKQANIAIAIQPDDSALKAWLGEPVAEVDDSGVVIVCRYDYKPKDKFYSPKGLK